MAESKIIYTLTDEAPLLATYSFLPIIEPTPSTAGVPVETRDISLAGRILANFPEYLRPDQRVGDDLAELGALTMEPEANIIKLPNISASVPQLKEAIEELQSQGYDVPDYPDMPQTDEETRSAPSTRRCSAAPSTRCCARATPTAARPASVKQYARAHPHTMGAWSPDSKTNVATHERRRLPVERKVGRHARRRLAAHRAGRATTARPPCSATRCRCSRARSSTARDERRRAATSSSSSRSSGPRTRTCCSRCTSRPR